MTRYADPDLEGRRLIDWAPKKGDKELIVVLYELPSNSYTPWVTWIARKEDPKSTFWGHYHRTMEEAQADFEKRAYGTY